jgi:hypothetical protein
MTISTDGWHRWCRKPNLWGRCGACKRPRTSWEATRADNRWRAVVRTDIGCPVPLGESLIHGDDDASPTTLVPKAYLLYRKGAAPGCGHWWAIVQRPDNAWVEANDSTVTVLEKLPDSSREALICLFSVVNEDAQSARDGVRFVLPEADDVPTADEAHEHIEAERKSSAVQACPGGAVAGCIAKNKKKQPCKSAAVEGYKKCALHLYGQEGKGTCREATATGECGGPRSAGLSVCASHAVQAAAGRGHGPPVPGKGITSGPRLDTASGASPMTAAPATGEAPTARPTSETTTPPTTMAPTETAAPKTKSALKTTVAPPAIAPAATAAPTAPEQATLCTATTKTGGN